MNIKNMPERTQLEHARLPRLTKVKGGEVSSCRTSQASRARDVASTSVLARFVSQELRRVHDASARGAESDLGSVSVQADKVIKAASPSFPDAVIDTIFDRMIGSHAWS